MRVLSFRTTYLCAWLMWFGILWWLSSGELPGPEDVPEIPFFDKVMHWGYFGIGSALSTMWVLMGNRLGRLTLWAMLGVLGLGMAVGALDEWHQSWCVYRSGNDLGDFLADTVGTLSGCIVVSRLYPWLQSWGIISGRD